jgi:hypothetical protein
MMSVVLLAMMRSVLVIFLVFCVVFCCPACYDEARVGHLFSLLCCIPQKTKNMTNTDLIIASKTKEYNTKN